MSSHFSQESEGLTSDLNEPDTGSSPNAKPTKRPEQSSGDTGPTSRSTRTSAPTSRPRKPTSSAADSRAKTCQLLGNGPDSQANAPACSSRQPESLTLFSETADGFSLRMYPDSFPQTADEISESFSRRWPTSGFTTLPGECWTADTSESPNEGGAFSSLPDVLVADVPPRFYLSPKAAAGIIRRAEKRGRALPDELDQSLRTLSTSGEAEQTTTTHKPTISSPSPSPPSGEKDQADLPETSVRTSSVKAFTQNTRDEVRYIGPKGEGDHTAALAASAGMKQTNYLHNEKLVRRLTPTECERLQGFPDGWTIT